MNVIFVSNCRDNAAKRTQRILDSYAIRLAPRTWASPVTEQGLSEIRRASRSHRKSPQRSCVL